MLGIRVEIWLIIRNFINYLMFKIMKKALSLKVIIGAIVLIAVLAVAGSALAQINPLSATITAPTNGASFNIGQSITFSSTVSGGISPYVYLWDFDGNGTTDGLGQNFTKSDGFATAGSKTITLTVGDSANPQSTVTRTITVNITDSSTPALAISNIQVTNVTQNGATVTWTTNKGATSRVIYDTVSHSSIAGASAPNYGYANSTGTTNTDPKVTSHSVTLTGLSANTQYFFRVVSES